MPELPEVEALASFLRERAVGRAVQRADVAAFSAVKTFDPPLTALRGALVTDASRYGKFLSLDFDDLQLVMHLARGGWLQWRDSLPPAPPRPGRSPLAFRLHLAPELVSGPVAGFDLGAVPVVESVAEFVGPYGSDSFGRPFVDESL